MIAILREALERIADGDCESGGDCDQVESPDRCNPCQAREALRAFADAKPLTYDKDLRAGIVEAILEQDVFDDDESVVMFADTILHAVSAHLRAQVAK